VKKTQTDNPLGPKYGEQTLPGDPNGLAIVIIMKTSEDDAPVIKLPKMYKDDIESPEGQHWKEVMDCELTKLKEMNTWTEIDQSDLPPGAQVLPGMRVHLIKNLETGECKFRSR